MQAPESKAAPAVCAEIRALEQEAKLKEIKQELPRFEDWHPVD